MEHSISWEAKLFYATQNIRRNLCNLKVHYCIPNSPQPDPIQIHNNPVHARLSNSWIIIIIILLSHKSLDLPIGLFPLELPNKTLYTSLLSPLVYIPLQNLSSLFGNPNNIWWYTQITELLNM